MIFFFLRWLNASPIHLVSDTVFRGITNYTEDIIFSKYPLTLFNLYFEKCTIRSIVNCTSCVQCTQFFGNLCKSDKTIIKAGSYEMSSFMLSTFHHCYCSYVMNPESSIQTVSSLNFSVCESYIFWTKTSSLLDAKYIGFFSGTFKELFEYIDDGNINNSVIVGTKIANSLGTFRNTYFENCSFFYINEKDTITKFTTCKFKNCFTNVSRLEELADFKFEKELTITAKYGFISLKPRVPSVCVNIIRPMPIIRRGAISSYLIQLGTSFRIKRNTNI